MASKKLKGWKAARDVTKDEAPFGELIPAGAGLYTMQLVSAKIDHYGNRDAVMRRWYVIDNEEVEDNERLNTDFAGLADEQNLAWIQRDLTTLGVDPDEIDALADHDGLQAVFDRLVTERACCRVRVTDDGTYKNMKLMKPSDVEESALVDPASVTDDDVSFPQQDDDGTDAATEDELKVGMQVSIEKRGKTIECEIVEFDDDQNPVLKPHGKGTKRFSAPVDMEITILESGGDGEDSGDNNDKQAKFPVGARVSVTIAGADWGEGEVVSCPPGGDQVRVKFDMDGAEENVSTAGAKVLSMPESNQRAIEVGDGVMLQIRGQDKHGTVDKLHDDDTADVKVGKSLVKKVSLDKLSHQVEH